MRNILVTIVGRDRPGIIHQVSKVLAEYRCHVVEVSQTTLLGEFAGLFSGRLAAQDDLDEFSAALAKALEGSGLAHWVTRGEGDPAPAALDREPYVVTVRGPDRLGVIPEVSGVIYGFDANIDTLRSVGLSGEPEAGDQTRPEAGEAEENRRVVMFFEISVPREVNQRAFRQALNLAAESLGLEMSLQHRDIFEAIHRL